MNTKEYYGKPDQTADLLSLIEIIRDLAYEVTDTYGY